ncbi:MAG: YggS family pyridoxal phosphate-dependent enzyme [Kiritimatiellae bacterium]|nr:YggS family pyridoxal phosphate-dependent enzyme [Kiritimatiellia bacterium]
MQGNIEERLSAIRGAIGEACRAAGRKAGEVEIIAVTKTHGPDAVREAWDAGLRIMGENKVQEAAAKIPASVSGPEWHLIGHLQKNKVRHALALFTTIHSVDSLDLLQAIDRVAEEDARSPHILLEVNVSGESSKFGIRPDALPSMVEAALQCRRLTLDGFMTMAPFSPNAEDSRPHFARLRELRDAMEGRFGALFPRLSMGMSGDYAVAASEGATWVRIGTALFGPRAKWSPRAPESNDRVLD